MQWCQHLPSLLQIEPSEFRQFYKHFHFMQTHLYIEIVLAKGIAAIVS